MTTKPRVHFMGIGGSGMNAVAGIAHAMGYVVSGCDLKESEYTADLLAKGLPIAQGHAAEHINDCDILCVSPAIFDLNADHAEVQAARESGIPVMTWQQFMGEKLQTGKKVIAISGTKGKTTTTTLVGLLLEQAGRDPIVEVGGTVKEWNKNYRFGQGTDFVCEADEFNRNFLHFSPQIAVLTNIEMDHPEFFTDEEAYRDAYVQFVNKIVPGGVLIANVDSDGVRAVLEKVDHRRFTLVPYGRDTQADNALVRQQVVDGHSEFVVRLAGHEHSFSTNLPGEYNAMNALAALLVATQLGISTAVQQRVLASASGPGRRFELLCDHNNIKVYNDYAHNPMSVSAAVKAARELFPQARLWAVFQPHLYSRTKMFLKEFAQGLAQADRVVIVDIYPSREKGKPIANTVHSRDLVAQVQAIARSSVVVEYGGDVAASTAKLIAAVQPGDVVLNMGAGDNTALAQALCRQIQSE